MTTFRLQPKKMGKYQREDFHYTLNLPATPMGVGHSLGTGGKVRANCDWLKYASAVTYSYSELYVVGMSIKLALSEKF